MNCNFVSDVFWNENLVIWNTHESDFLINGKVKYVKN